MQPTTFSDNYTGWSKNSTTLFRELIGKISFYQNLKNHTVNVRVLSVIFTVLWNVMSKMWFFKSIFPMILTKSIVNSFRLIKLALVLNTAKNTFPRFLSCSKSKRNHRLLSGDNQIWITSKSRHSELEQISISLSVVKSKRQLWFWRMLMKNQYHSNKRAAYLIWNWRNSGKSKDWRPPKYKYLLVPFK